jgi:hypothetical protein
MDRINKMLLMEKAGIFCMPVNRYEQPDSNLDLDLVFGDVAVA